MMPWSVLLRCCDLAHLSVHHFELSKPINQIEEIILSNLTVKQEQTFKNEESSSSAHLI